MFNMRELTDGEKEYGNYLADLYRQNLTRIFNEIEASHDKICDCGLTIPLMNPIEWRQLKKKELGE